MNWFSDESHLILNPKLSASERERYEECFRRSLVPGHVWVASSGSQARKLIGLSKEAVMTSASAVNKHLHASSADRWGVCLPRYHVGGLGIEARALLAGSRVVNFSSAWNPTAFCRWLTEERVTLTSLVPTQVFDLVQDGLPSPVVLRAVVVGGAALDEDVYYRARCLGWPLLPSFGMTETASQIATATLSSLQGSIYPKLQLLEHVEARQSAEGLLEVRSAARTSGFWNVETMEFHQLIPGQWFTSEDLVQLEDRSLFPLGRNTDFIKIKGEGLHLSQIEDRIRAVTHLEGSLVAVKDPRDGARLVWVVEGNPSHAQKQIEKWNLNAFPLERIPEVRSVEKIPKGTLGKNQRQKLSQLLEFRD